MLWDNLGGVKFNSNQVLPTVNLEVMVPPHRVELQTYFVKNIKAGTNEQNNLNVMYGDYNPIYNGFKLTSKNKMISFMKKIVNLIFPNVYNYDNYLNINESKIFFFTDS